MTFSKISLKKILSCLAVGMYLSAVVTWNYRPDPKQTTNYHAINRFLKIAFSFNGFGMTTAFLAIFFAVAVFFVIDMHHKKGERPLHSLQSVVSLGY